jgi:hypothetical protein
MPPTAPFAVILADTVFLAIDHVTTNRIAKV